MDSELSQVQTEQWNCLLLQSAAHNAQSIHKGHPALIARERSLKSMQRITANKVAARDIPRKDSQYLLEEDRTSVGLRMTTAVVVCARLAPLSARIVATVCDALLTAFSATACASWKATLPCTSVALSTNLLGVWVALRSAQQQIQLHVLFAGTPRL